MAALQVEHVESGSPAEQAGIQLGDIIISVNDQHPETVDELIAIGKSKKVFNLVIFADGKEKTVTVEGERLGCKLARTAAPVGSSAGSGSSANRSSGVQFESQYKVNQALTTLTSIIGWLVFGGGLAASVILLLDNQFGMGLSAGIIAVLGLALIQISQISRAITDTADYTREMYLLQKNKS
ncbi:MAG: PDZ domain-containing protein [Marinospirillum sp.]|uniref:PDZ domain-containing protein n=1 Tax=Marinospirillum sp. TaxID=2183934 RepID=UPI0019DFBAC6|nr:PDZ domain-containing protein [Marinospirillum sp.]MBE0508122.1 PDZ domain-containing protein [Marinospirillum sp.]